jgi:hypothetical protein
VHNPCVRDVHGHNPDIRLQVVTTG